MSIQKHIAEIPLFEGLPPDNHVDLASIALEKRFAKGETIFSEGQDGSGFYVIVSGRVKIFKLSADGKEQILHLFGAGEPFGEVPVFEGKRFPAHAMALQASRLLFFSRVSFVDLIKRNPSLSLNMLAVLSRRLRLFTALVDDLSLKEVPGRLAAHLLYASEKAGGTDEFTLDLPKGQLAGMLGTIPETLSRILTRFVKHGLIVSDGPRITILDMKGLQELMEGTRKL